MKTSRLTWKLLTKTNSAQMPLLIPTIFNTRIPFIYFNLLDLRELLFVETNCIENMSTRRLYLCRKSIDGAMFWIQNKSFRFFSQDFVHDTNGDSYVHKHNASQVQAELHKALSIYLHWRHETRFDLFTLLEIYYCYKTFHFSTLDLNSYLSKT